MIELKADRLVKPNKSHSADWNLEHFKQQFKIVMGAMDEDSLEFDLIGIDVSIANALRRIMIAEIPTMAIENVYILNNTSIVQDEVLAHRLGLVPIKVDPTQFDFRTDDEPPTDLNTVVLTLLAQCSKNPNASPDDVDPRQLYISSNVYSSMLQWKPHGDQAERFESIGPVHDDILLAKLRPGQEIHAELHCKKGVGKEHAKWSPVATASYKCHPEITLLETIQGPLALKLQACFASGVISIVKDKAIVENARNDTGSREVLRHPEFEKKVKLGRNPSHFICIDM